MYKANKELCDELTKRLNLVRNANTQIVKCNYGIAQKLLRKALNDPLKVAIIEE